MSLDDRLTELLLLYGKDAKEDIGVSRAVYLRQIKQAFLDEGYVTPDNAAKVQDMVNQMANLAAESFHLPTIQYIKPNKAMTKAKNLMTGQKWYDRFKSNLPDAGWMVDEQGEAESAYYQHDVEEAAIKAAGL